MRCAVFFNIDDTLTEFTKDFEDIYQEAIKEAGLDELKDHYGDYTDRFFDYFQDGWAYPRRQAIDQLSRKHDCYDPEKVEAFASAWERIEADAIQLRDGVEDMLDAIDGKYHI
ncbi:MAG: hypothetical protein SVU32_02990, partial [Candidatus Nanohaloarchaea archaeon]|nr:hypothetical protein [Candidatus Nanohaloarchaea archaeon]